MNALFEWFARLIGSWKFWLVVAPWDIGIRIRLGKVAAKLRPGVHFRIPFIDEIVFVNTRQRATSSPPITLKGAVPGTARIVTGTLMYRISDPLAAMMAYSEANGFLAMFLQSAIVHGKNEAQCLEAINYECGPNGIEAMSVFFSEDVQVKTYRILNGGGGGYLGGGGVYPSFPGQKDSQY